MPSGVSAAMAIDLWLLILCNFACVYVTFVYRVCTYMYACTCRVNDRGRCYLFFPIPLHLFLRQNPSLNPALTDWLNCLAGELGILSSLPPSTFEPPTMPGSDMGAEDLNSPSHGCMAGTLPTEMSSWRPCVSFLAFYFLNYLCL